MAFQLSVGLALYSFTPSHTRCSCRKNGLTPSPSFPIKGKESIPFKVEVSGTGNEVTFLTTRRYPSESGLPYVKAAGYVITASFSQTTQFPSRRRRRRPDKVTSPRFIVCRSFLPYVNRLGDKGGRHFVPNRITAIISVLLARRNRCGLGNVILLRNSLLKVSEHETSCFNVDSSTPYSIHITLNEVFVYEANAEDKF